MRIMDSAQVSAKITGIRASAKSIRENVQVACLGLVGHALKYGSSTLGNRLLAAVNPQDRKFIGAWMAEFGPFAYDSADNTLQVSKAKRAKIGANTDDEIEALLDRLNDEAQTPRWFEAKPARAKPDVDSIDFLDSLEAWLKKAKKQAENNPDVPQLNVNALAEVTTLVLAMKRDAYDRENKIGRYAPGAANEGRTDSAHVVDVAARDVTPKGNMTGTEVLHLAA